MMPKGKRTQTILKVLGVLQLAVPFFDGVPMQPLPIAKALMGAAAALAGSTLLDKWEAQKEADRVAKAAAAGVELPKAGGLYK